MRKARAAGATNSTCSSTGPWSASACGGRRPVLRMGDWEESFKPAKKALRPPRGLALALLGLVWSSPGLAQSDQRGTDDLREAAQNPISDLISLPFQNNLNFATGKHSQPQVPTRRGQTLQRPLW